MDLNGGLETAFFAAETDCRNWEMLKNGFDRYLGQKDVKGSCGVAHLLLYTDVFFSYYLCFS